MSSKVVNYASLLEDGQDDEEGQTSYGVIGGFSCTLNSIIGTGVLGLPFMFARCGIGLATSLLAAGALLSGVSMAWTLESMARAEGVRRFYEDEGPWRGHEIGVHKKFDFAQLARLFAGWRIEMITQIAVVSYAFGALWSYASVFGSTSAALVREYIVFDEMPCDPALTPSPACTLTYNVAILFFGCLVVALALIDLGDQSIVQTTMSVYRVLALFAMTMTALIKIKNEGIAPNIPNFRFDQFGVGFGPVFLAINCHYNCPDLVAPLREKKYAGRVIYSAMALSVSFYLAVGLCTALAFGADTAPLATLNWANYPWTTATSAHFLYGHLFLRFLIVLCPVVNVLSAYPIIVCSVAENLQHTLRPAKEQPILRIPPSRSPALNPHRALSPPNAVTTRRARKEASLLRLLVAVIPLIFAILVRRLDLIFSISGIFGFILGLVLPITYQYFSLLYCRRVLQNLSPRTPFSLPCGFSTSTSIAFIALVFSCILTLVAFFAVAAEPAP